MGKLLACYLLSWCVSAWAVASEPFTYIVAQDGSGDYKTVQAAIDATKAFPPSRMSILIKNGTYIEKVRVPEMNTELSLIGESVDKTVIVYADHFDKINRGRNSTFYTATVSVEADDFVMKNITIQNASGDIGQALALSVNANRAVFDNVKLLGNQDTLYVTGEGNKMLFKNCYVEGTTDFIFGGASAVFSNCTIHSLKDSYITAASTPKGQAFGFVFTGCQFTAAPDATKVYLGRPWRVFAQTLVMDSDLGSHILPEGWHNWNKPEAELSAFYGEFHNRGPGASIQKRVPWSKQLSAKQASQFQLDVLLQDKMQPDWFQR